MSSRLLDCATLHQGLFIILLIGISYDKPRQEMVNINYSSIIQVVLVLFIFVSQRRYFLQSAHSGKPETVREYLFITTNESSWFSYPPGVGIFGWQAPFQEFIAMASAGVGGVIEPEANYTFFFGESLRNYHLLNPLTTVIFNLNGVEEVPHLLKQISMYLTIANINNVTRCTHVPFIIIIPLEKAANAGDDERPNSCNLMTKGHIENLILDKVDPLAKQSLVIDTSIFLVFSTRDKLLNLQKISTCDFDIWEVYSIRKQTFLNRVNKSLSSLMAGDLEKISRRGDWNGVEIMGLPYTAEIKLNDTGELTGIEKYETNIIRDSNDKVKFHLLSGLIPNIIWDMGTALNFRIGLLQPMNWEISINDAYDYYGHSFDIVLSHLATVPGRKVKFDYLIPTYLEGFVASFVQPPIYSFRNIHTTPFTPSVWLLLIISWAIITISIKLVCQIRAGLLSECLPHSWKEELMKLDAYLWTIASACQQGWHITPRSIPIKAIFLTGLSLGFICFAAYTATVVSLLGKPVVPIDSLEELLESSKIIYVVKGSSVSRIIANGMARRNPELFPKVRMTDLRNAFDRVVFEERGTSCVLDYSEYFTEMAHDVFGTEGQPNSGNPNVAICEHISKFSYHHLPVKAAMVVAKRSPLKKSLNYMLLISFERGFFRRYLNEYNLNTKVRCLELDESTNVFYALSIFDTSFAFLIVLGGIVLSLVILGMEIVHRRRVIVNAIMEVR